MIQRFNRRRREGAEKREESQRPIPKGSNLRNHLIIFKSVFLYFFLKPACGRIAKCHGDSQSITEIHRESPIRVEINNFKCLFVSLCVNPL